MSGLHRRPSFDTLTQLTKDLTSRAAHLRGKVTGRTLTRVTGGVAVGAVLVTTATATVSMADSGAPHAEPAISSAAAGQDTVNDFLTTGQTTKLMAKPKKAPAHPRNKPVTVDDVIKLAETQVGITETNGRGGGTKFQNWYVTTDRAEQTTQRDGGYSPGDYKNAAWCVMFLSWLGKQLDFNDQIGSDAWTIAHAQWFKDNGRWGDTPKPGAVVYFDWDGGSKDINAIDHVALVAGVNDDGTIDTIDGNISDAVVKRTRGLDSVVGFGYPDYAR